MRIDILQQDGLGLAAEAWRLSRNVDSHVGWDEVFTLDCPVTEFPSAVLNFCDFTVLEREILASSRTHVMWARTSFVDDPLKYRLPEEMEELSDPVTHLELRDEMRRGKEAGLHQDEFRQSLPVMALTSFSMRMGFRDAVKFCSYFRYLGDATPRPQRDRFMRVHEALAAVCDKFTGSRASTQRALSSMGLTKFLHESEVHPHPDVRTTGFHVVAFEMPVWLRAHFARHRPLAFIDDIFHKIIMRDDLMEVTFREKICMEVAASDEFWMSLLGKRSCWLTQSTLRSDRDPWAVIVDQFAEAGRKMLPCRHGVCPFAVDAMLRVEGKEDPGAPCPMFLKLNDIDRGPHLAAIEQALASRPAFWRSV